MKTIYIFNSQTRELIGSAVADESPLEPGKYLMPTDATNIEPPEFGKKEIAVFVNNVWQVKPDWRGVQLFKTADGALTSITEIGVAPSDIDATEIPQPDETYSWGKGKWVIDKVKVAKKFENEKTEALNKASECIQQVRLRIAGTSDLIEVAAWSNKLRIATAIQAGTASDDEIAAFQSEITLRGMGETLDDFCKKVFANASTYSMACAVIDGLKRSTKDAINASQSKEEIDLVVEQMKSDIKTKLGV